MSGLASVLLLLAATTSPAPDLHAATEPDCGWTAAAEEQALLQATAMMPDGLRRILQRNRRSLRDGMRDARAAAARTPLDHRQGPAALEGTAARLAASTGRITDLLDRRAPMRQVARELGAAAHWVADLSNPFRGVPAGAAEDVYGPRFAIYIEEKLPRLRVVFEGYSDPLLEAGDVEAFGRHLADQSRSYLDDLLGAYRRFDNGERAAFDERSVPFGVAALTYSRTVTDTARIWLAAWRAAHGDLAGLPYPLHDGARVGADAAHDGS